VVRLSASEKLCESAEEFNLIRKSHISREDERGGGVWLAQGGLIKQANRRDRGLTTNKGKWEVVNDRKGITEETNPHR